MTLESQLEDTQIMVQDYVDELKKTLALNQKLQQGILQAEKLLRVATTQEHKTLKEYHEWKEGRNRWLEQYGAKK